MSGGSLSYGGPIDLTLVYGQAPGLGHTAKRQGIESGGKSTQRHDAGLGAGRSTAGRRPAQGANHQPPHTGSARWQCAEWFGGSNLQHR